MVSLVTNKVIVEDNSLTVLLPEGFQSSIEQLLGKKQGWIHLHVGTPQKQRSTGPRSENNLIHGSCALIAEQLGYLETMGKGQATEYVKDAMKRMAVGSRGYPTTFNEIDGHEEPMSLAYATSEQAQMVIDTILDFCSFQDLWLVRYNDKNEPEMYWVSSGKAIQ